MPTTSPHFPPTTLAQAHDENATVIHAADASDWPDELFLVRNLTTGEEMLVESREGNALTLIERGWGLTGKQNGSVGDELIMLFGFDPIDDIAKAHLAHDHADPEGPPRVPVEGLSGEGRATGDIMEADGDGNVRWTTEVTPKSHSESHEVGGDDEINVAGLSGVLADAQVPQIHGNEKHSVDYATASALDSHIADASEGVHGSSQAATSGSLAQRYTGGRLRVGTPVNDNDAGTKKYIDDLVAAGVEFREEVINRQNDPPASHADGDRYIVGSAPTGDWVGEADNFAVGDGTDWTFIPVQAGDTVFLTGTGAVLTYTDADGWVTFFEAVSHSTLSDLDADDHLQYVHISEPRNITAHHTFKANQTFEQDVQIDGDLNVGGVLEVVNGTGSSKVVGDFEVTGDLTVGGVLDITNGEGPSTITGDLELDGSLIIINQGLGDNPVLYSNSDNKVLSINGAMDVSTVGEGTVFHGDVTVEGDLTVGGVFQAHGDPGTPSKIEGDLEVTGDLTVGGVFEVTNGTGTSKITGDFEVTGDLIVGGVLDVNDGEGPSTIKGDLELDGALIIVNQGSGENPSLYSNSANKVLSINGALDVSTEDNGTVFHGDVTVEGIFTAGGDVDLASNDLIDGATVIWDTFAGHIPQARLENDTINIGTGTGLSGGGNIALGSTRTISALPFQVNAGAALTGGGSANLGGSVTLNVSTGNGIRVASDQLEVVAGVGLTQNVDGLAAKKFQVAAGTGLAGGGSDDLGGSVTLTHESVAAASSTGNANGVVLQNLDTNPRGHVTSITTTNLDNRYVELAGDTMTGNLAMDNNKITGLDQATASGQAVHGGRTLTGGKGISSIGDFTQDRTISVDEADSFNWTGGHVFEGGGGSLATQHSSRQHIQLERTGDLASTFTVGFWGEDFAVSEGTDTDNSRFLIGHTLGKGNVVYTDTGADLGASGERWGKGFFSDTLDMGSSKITGLAQGTASGEAVHAGRTISSGNSLSGGGNLTSNRTLNVVTNPANQTAVGDTRTITAGSALSGGGDLTQDRTLNVKVGSGIRIQSDQLEVTAGTDLVQTSTGLAHANTGGAQSVNSNPVVIQSVHLDGRGHVDQLDNVNLHSMLDSRYVELTGDTMTGLLTVSEGLVSGANVNPDGPIAHSLGTQQTKWHQVHAQELVVGTLVAEDTAATIGGRIMVAPTTSLTSSVSTGATEIEVQHNNLTNGDVIVLQVDGDTEFMQVTSSASGTGPYTYSVTRNLDGGGAKTWDEGGAVVGLGQAGDGFMDIYSSSGLDQGVGPTIVGNVRQSSTWNDWTPGWAIGNLQDLYGYTSKTFGAAFGEYKNDNSFITIDDDAGVRIQHRSGGSNTVLGQWATSGSFTLGEVGVGKANLHWDGSELLLRSNATANIKLDTEGRIQAGSSTSDILIDGANKFIGLGGANAFTGTSGIFIGLVSGASKLRAGDNQSPEGDYLSYDESTGKIEISGTFISDEGSSIPGTTEHEFTVNSERDDVAAKLILGRTTGGDLEVSWDGSTAALNRALAMGNNKITGLAQGVSSGEAIHAGRTLTAGAALSGGGDLTQNRTFNVKVGSGIRIASDQLEVTAGSGLSQESTGLAHANTGGASSNNSDPVVIQSVTLDGFGHVDSFGTRNLHTLLDPRYVERSGDSMTGALAMGSNKITGLAQGTVSGDAVHAGRSLTGGTGIASIGNLTQDRTIALDTGHNRNVDHSAVSITAGTALSGGGDITSSRTLNVRIGSGIRTDASDNLEVTAGTGLDQTATGLALTTPVARGHLPGAVAYEDEQNTFVSDQRINRVLGTYHHHRTIPWTSSNTPSYLLLIKKSTTAARISGQFAGSRNTSSGAYTTISANVDIGVGTGGGRGASLVAWGVNPSLNPTALVEVDFEGETWIALDFTGSTSHHQPHNMSFSGYVAGTSVTDFQAIDEADASNVISHDETSFMRVQGPLTLGTQGTSSGQAIHAGRSLTGGTGIASIGNLTQDRTIALDTGHNRNVDHSAVSITAGSALSGGGDITTSRTLNVKVGSGIQISNDQLEVTAGTGLSQNTSGLGLNTSHDRNVDHSAVSITAGSALSGGGDITSSRTLNVKVGNGIRISSDQLEVVAGTGLTQNADGVAVNAGHAFTWGAKHTFQGDVDIDGDVSIGGALSVAGGEATFSGGVVTDGDLTVNGDLTVKQKMKAEDVIETNRVSEGNLPVSAEPGSVVYNTTANALMVWVD